MSKKRYIILSPRKQLSQDNPAQPFVVNVTFFTSSHFSHHSGNALIYFSLIECLGWKRN